MEGWAGEVLGGAGCVLLILILALFLDCGFGGKGEGDLR